MSLAIVCHAEDCPSRQNRDKPMKCIDETSSTFIFQCQTCLNVRGVGKAQIGMGTIGAGRRDDQPARQWIGRGMDYSKG